MRVYKSSYAPQSMYDVEHPTPAFKEAADLTIEEGMYACANGRSTFVTIFR